MLCHSQHRLWILSEENQKKKLDGSHVTNSPPDHEALTNTLSRTVRVWHCGSHFFSIHVVQNLLQATTTVYVDRPRTTTMTELSNILTDKSNSEISIHHNIFEDGSALILQNVLTRQECQALKDFADANDRMQSCGYKATIRVTDRLEVSDESTANLLFERLRPCLKDLDLTNIAETLPRGVDPRQQGRKWVPKSIKPKLRLCRYSSEGFFLPHYDEDVTKSEYERSFCTIMIYLNDDFEGGATHFYNQHQRHYQIANDEHCVYTYQPRTGDALLFLSQITHDGGRVVSGKKYIMRSEVLYSAVGDRKVTPTLQPDHGDIANEPDFVPDGWLSEDSDDED